MKKLLVLASSLTILSLASAQDTLCNLLQVGNKWTRMQSQKFYDHKAYTEVLKDTTLGQQKYALVKDTKIQNFSNDIHLFGLRQDALSMYYKSLDDDSPEVLMYRFTGLNLGDSAIVTQEQYNIVEPGFDYDTSVITQIDSIILGTHYTKRYKLSKKLHSSYFIDCYFIDGVGSTGGGLFIAPMSQIEFQLYLMCVHNSWGDFKHGREAYLSKEEEGIFIPTSTPCELVNNVHDEKEADGIQSIYNPDETITLQGSIHTPYEIKLYDLQGRLALSNKQQTTATFSVATLNTGPYLVHLYTREGAVYKATFVKW
ncbi:MAG TPA: T9SS type A sorting domain-containing protein [Cytophagales bacterium]|nr:T9SS type A sorting domain-containing protein [Cytophagales bacterium]